MCKSGLISAIWEQEAKRGLWALLGEAYSDIRDHHKEVIDLTEFFALAVPLLPIIPAHLYLVKMGWELVTTSTGEAKLSRNPNFNAEILETEYPGHTNLSAKDIVNHCYQQGLANRAHRRRKPSLRELNAARMNNSPATTNQTPPPSCGALTLLVVPQTVCRLFMQMIISSHLLLCPDCHGRSHRHQCFSRPGIPRKFW
jgi:hypothetical protein